ncbi:MAG: DNA mismatch repair endonuclease MutL [Pseudomonadota bacterium]|nr:DNA mismatch repair endonuclease MutL [Pseudomonadota bacterium]
MEPDSNQNNVLDAARPKLAQKINILPPELAHRIAAGEVIERPASILKELLENALDAGATVIQIELVKGGCDALRVTDNGAGMEPADVPLAFQRHATSKLTVFDDLYRLRSFGFRGEALPSIAAVARVELTTRPATALGGTTIVAENSRVEELREAGCPVGTTIHVSQIFAAVPARRKFLKSEATEQGACLEAVNRIALASPGVKFRVLNNGRLLWDMPATADAGERIGMVLGRETGSGLLKVKGVRGELTLEGYISRPEITRANAKDIYCFVNGRCIRDALLNHALMTACRNVMAAKRYPAAVLFLTMPSEEVDINVHPAKLEVRFQNPRAIYGLVVETILAGFAAVAPALDDGASPMPATDPGDANLTSQVYQRRLEEAVKRYTLLGGAKKSSYRSGASFSAGSGALFSAAADRRRGRRDDDASAGEGSPSFLGGGERGNLERRHEPGFVSEPTVEAAAPRDPADAPAFPGSEDGSPRRYFASMTYLGQAGGCYLVFSHDHDLILVDQHAAHERILYEELRREGREGRLAVQPLLIPEVATLSPGDYGMLMEHRDLLREAGLEIEPFGGHTVSIRSLPAALGRLAPRTLLEESLAQLTGPTEGLSWGEKRDRVLISLACQGAVKKGQILSEAEAVRLGHDLDRLPFAGTCPHGRPVWIVLTERRLAGLFRRT